MFYNSAVSIHSLAPASHREGGQGGWVNHLRILQCAHVTPMARNTVSRYIDDLKKVPAIPWNLIVPNMQPHQLPSAPKIKEPPHGMFTRLPYRDEEELHSYWNPAGSPRLMRISKIICNSRYIRVHSFPQIKEKLSISINSCHPGRLFVFLSFFYLPSLTFKYFSTHVSKTAHFSHLWLKIKLVSGDLSHYTSQMWSG